VADDRIVQTGGDNEPRPGAPGGVQLRQAGDRAGADEHVPTINQDCLRAYVNTQNKLPYAFIIGIDCITGLQSARILARHLRGDLPEYLPCVLR